VVLDVVEPAFRRAVALLVDESERMPLDRWNEWVCRYFFGRTVAEAHPGVGQLVESGRIDLVLERRRERAYIEFKFYRRQPRIPPDGGPQRGYKGGPGVKNLQEFRSCIDRLAAHPAAPGLQRFVVVVYADPPPGLHPRQGRFADYLDSYEHPNEDVRCRLVATAGPFETSGSVVHSSLIEVE
jgi:hypothetical protein